jgi:hypothetical protein
MAARLDARATLVVAAGLLAALMAGALATTERGVPLMVLAAAAAGGVALARLAPGVLVGVLVMGILDCLPGPGLGTAVADLLSFALIGFLVVRVLADGRAALARPGVRLAIWWTTLFVGWWLVTWLRSVIGGRVSPVHALLYGREFLVFALLVPLMLAGLRRRDLPPLMWTVGGLGALTALGHVAVVLSGTDLPLLIHPGIVSREGGLARIYSSGNDLVIALLPLALGAALLGRTR